MSTAVKILADSIAPGVPRLTTFELTFPRFILAELNTHRMFSRNSASSRAIPTEKIIQRVTGDPFIPVFGSRVKGMGVGEELPEKQQIVARNNWLFALNESLDAAIELLHTDKSRVNRLLEPFMWHTAIVTATDWDNFFALRTAPEAQPEFRELALMMQDAYQSQQPKSIISTQAHLPLVKFSEVWEQHVQGDHDDDDLYWPKVSVGRCARVSYLTHDGKRDPEEDIKLHDRLLENKHLSPFEHVAWPFSSWDLRAVQQAQQTIRRCENLDQGYKDDLYRQLEYHGNLRGWHSMRTTIANEHNAAL